MINSSTVFALSTPVGGAITVLRITGSDSKAVLSSVFTGKIEHGRIAFGRIADENKETVDEVMAVFFKAPHSYTGEDMAEIYCHGSYAVVQKLSSLILSAGLAVPAEAGEFTRRAYLNGKLDLVEAEAVMDLISSTAERSRRAAVSQLSGRLSAVIASFYERIKLLTAELANYMDDDSGEVVLDRSDFSLKTKGICREIFSLCESGMRARVLREGARLAIIGSPNAGKSSLLNALIMRDRSIVTPIPGTTRDTVEESLSVEGIPVVLVDTAGIRDPSDEVERLGIGRSLAAADEADLILMLFDGTREPDGGDMSILGRIDRFKALAVITKSDLDCAVFPDENDCFCGLKAVRISSVTGDGLGTLRRAIANELLPADGDEPMITNIRHISALRSAAEHLNAASALILDDDTDAAFFELKEAMDFIAGITGVSDPGEELIDSVFSRFCIGK